MHLRLVGSQETIVKEYNFLSLEGVLNIIVLDFLGSENRDPVLNL